MTDWYVAWTECRVCPDGARHISVFPVGADETALECPRCHAMSAEAVEYVPPDPPLIRFHDGEGNIT